MKDEELLTDDYDDDEDVDSFSEDEPLGVEVGICNICLLHEGNCCVQDKKIFSLLYFNLNRSYNTNMSHV